MSINKNIKINQYNGTDYDVLYPITLVENVTGAQPAITTNGILKGAGDGNVTAAVAGTDYVTPSQLQSEVGDMAAALSIISGEGD